MATLSFSFVLTEAKFLSKNPVLLFLRALFIIAIVIV